MGARVIQVVKEKYLDTDIDSLVLHFGDTNESCLVSDYPIPDEEPYRVLVSKNGNAKQISWIEVVNPQGVLSSRSPVLPELGEIEYKGESSGLIEVLQELMK